MALVKMISVHFPPYATYDLNFAGTECIQHSSSDIEIESCRIDQSTYTMWIDPYEKTTYQNNHDFQIETKGLAIINPITTTTFNRNEFIVKYYTW